MKQAVSYLGELIHQFDSDPESDFSNIPFMVLNDDDFEVKVLKIEIPSRHKKRQKYRSFVRYRGNVNSVDGILEYSCECANGSRTIGSCSHVAAMIYYLSYARYQAKIIQPSQLLNNLFDKNFEGDEVTIHTDSEEED